MRTRGLCVSREWSRGGGHPARAEVSTHVGEGEMSTMLLPEKREFVRLSKDHDVVPVAREIYADLTTPISAFHALAQDAPYAFLLESVIGGERLGRYSFLGIGADRVVTARRGVVEIAEGPSRRTVPARLPRSSASARSPAQRR